VCVCVCVCVCVGGFVHTCDIQVTIIKLLNTCMQRGRDKEIKLLNFIIYQNLIKFT